MDKPVLHRLPLQAATLPDSVPLPQLTASIRASVNTCLWAFLFLAASLPLFAQLSLRNADVIKMVNAGLGEDLIITTVNAAPGYYDTSVDGLHALKSAGVTDKEFSAIVQKAFHICFAGTQKDHSEGLQLGEMEHLLQEFHCGPQHSNQLPQSVVPGSARN